VLRFLYDLRDLAEWTGPLRIFRSITFRAALGTAFAFALVVLLGPVFLRWMTRLKATEDVAKPDSSRLEDLHAMKSGTPTMGGLLILSGLVPAVVLFCDVTQGRVLGALGVLLLFGALGFVDDYAKLRGRKNGGLSKLEKLVAQTLLASLAAAVVWSLSTPETTRLLVPFTKWAEVRPDLGVFYWVFFVVVMLGCCNAVNLTDGLDGLAAGSTIMVCLTYAALAYIAGNAITAGYFRIPHVAGGGELAILSASMIGALMGFLWYNCHPAQVFMGDTGSLALGAVLAYIALVVKQEIVLALAGGVFVLEAVSVVLQVTSLRLRKRRVFRCAPFHHHLEFSDWHENKIVIRLWLVGAILAALGLATLKMH
jgi:phospho-N-acetylmuramoyl-pentapeptide-transferase